MKRCPFCAEEIQDAAIVCKHCGRELQGVNIGAVTVRAKSRGRFRLVAIIGGVFVVGFAALFLVGGMVIGLNPSLQNQHVSGECRLSGTAAVTASDAAVAAGVLAIANRDSSSWDDAELSIYGQIVSGPNNGTRAGVHKMRLEVTPGLNAINLSEFENADGSRWVPSTMRVDGIGITATLRGEHCALEQSFDRR